MHDKAGDYVASVAETWLADGPMGATLRSSDYRDFLSGAYGDGATAMHIATSCAVFAGACLILAEVVAPHPIPKARAITTWLGVQGFITDDPETEKIEGSWLPVADLEKHGGPWRGDVWYICSTAGRMPIGGGQFYVWTRWEAAANGHVGICLGDHWLTRTAEGGGSPGGTTCRISAEAKDIRKMGRTLRGVWRPAAMPPPKIVGPYPGKTA